MNNLKTFKIASLLGLAFLASCNQAVQIRGALSSSSTNGSSSVPGTTITLPSAGTGSSAPSPAAAVGYNAETFNSIAVDNSHWYNFNFYGVGAQAANAWTQNSDGSLLITGNENNSYGATVATASQTTTGVDWVGTAFGGGAYFEASISFTGQDSGPYSNGGPAFWTLDVEHTSQGPYTVNWPGQAKTYNDYFEVDFMEYDVNEFSFQNGIGNWYGDGLGTSNPYEAVSGVAGSVLVPSSTDFSKPHTYGCLWVPATPNASGGTATQGYLKFYFDGAVLPDPFYWNYNNPADPLPAPPVNGTSAMAGMDQRHMFLMLGTGTTQPMTVHSVDVWQTSDANNLKY